jgi:cytoskeletal protein RodZ
MVGLTMALTIALCIVGFIWVFIQLEPYVSDFVHRDPSSAQEQDSPPPSNNSQAQAEPTEEPTEEESQEPPPERPEPTPTPKPRPTATSSDFVPDYQLVSSEQVNLRAEPGAGDVPIVATLELATPLQFLGERQETSNPEVDLMDPGQVWMKFRTEDGEVGWIREFDVEPYSE